MEKEQILKLKDELTKMQPNLRMVFEFISYLADEELKKFKQTVEELELSKGVSKKLPLGIIPREMWHEQRIKDIERAIEDYTKAEKDIPRLWFVEYYILNKHTK